MYLVTETTQGRDQGGREGGREGGELVEQSYSAIMIERMKD